MERPDTPVAWPWRGRRPQGLISWSPGETKQSSRINGSVLTFCTLVKGRDGSPLPVFQPLLAPKNNRVVPILGLSLIGSRRPPHERPFHPTRGGAAPEFTSGG